MSHSGYEDLQGIQIDWSHVGPIMATTKCCGTGTCSKMLLKDQDVPSTMIEYDQKDVGALFQAFGDLRMQRRSHH